MGQTEEAKAEAQAAAACRGRLVRPVAALGPGPRERGLCSGVPLQGLFPSPPAPRLGCEGILTTSPVGQAFPSLPI